MNLALLLEMAADGLGDRVAIGRRDDGLTFAAVRDLVAAAAHRLNGSPAETVALTSGNAPLVPVALFGAAWSGRSYAPLNYRLASASLDELLARVQPAVVADESWLDDKNVNGGNGAAYPPEPERPAVLLFTSGTSAAPKAALLAHDHVLSYILTANEFGSADENEANLLAVPPFHIAGVAGVLSSTYIGRRIVPLPTFTAESWLATAQAEQVTHCFLVPTMLARIVAVMESDESARVPTLRQIAYGGARMPAPVLEKAMRLFPETGFVNAYGLTETSATVCLLGPEDHRDAGASDDPAVRRRLSSAGRPLPGVELAIIDGEICVRGPQVSGAYVGQASLVDDGGWLHTGDLGSIDDDGYLFVEGRADDMIICGGENISPSEIEDALLRHPDVTQAAVVGLPDDEWGERVAAMVALRPGATATPDAITGWARDQLGTLKAPKTVIFRDELPVTATGKLLRRQVRQDLASA